MLNTFASRPHHAHPLSLVLARLVLAVALVILALFAGYCLLLIVRMMG